MEYVLFLLSLLLTVVLADRRTRRHSYHGVAFQQSLQRCSSSKSSSNSSSRLWGNRMKFQPPPRVVSQTEYIEISRPEDAWKTMDVVEILQQRGGLGVLPTDTGYGFVTPLESKEGLERLLRLKGLQSCKKPLSLLCSDLRTIDEYCFGIDKLVFKLLKKNLPGAYTFVLPAKTTLPKGIIVNDKGQKKHSWKRHTLGVRIPQDPILRYLQDELLDGMPLLISSLPTDDDDEDGKKQTKTMMNCLLDKEASWFDEVDFVVDAGPRPMDGSTIYDLTIRGEPTLVREGLGDLELQL
jgi:tRNA threonylcarbamoyl adenosine modification protein (Sua5/YciO/YrdC/YwlC family)